MRPEPTSLKSLVPVEINVGTFTPFQGSGGISAIVLGSLIMSKTLNRVSLEVSS